MPNSLGFSVNKKRLALSETSMVSEVEPRSKSKGFTLVELLVVISIIAILSIIGIVVFTGIQKSGRDSRRISDIDAIMKALEVNYISGYGSISDSWFAGGKVPLDPLATAYSVLADSNKTCGSAHNKPCAYCARDLRDGTTVCSTAYVVKPSLLPASGIICATLETSAGPGGTYYYCRQTQQ